MSGCSLMPVEPVLQYGKVNTRHLANLPAWSFEGRLAVTDARDSWSASVDWQHADLAGEQIKLAGPLGQGAAVIRLKDQVVSIDRGGGKIESSADPEQFISQQLGVFVPVQSLRYWVLGMPEPSMAFSEDAEGFTQAGWKVAFKEMQLVGLETLPKKIMVVNKLVKIKLVIDDWNLNGAKAN
jgi:outer membrane lipoprotein LolB